MNSDLPGHRKRRERFPNCTLNAIVNNQSIARAGKRIQLSFQVKNRLWFFVGSTSDLIVFWAQDARVGRTTNRTYAYIKGSSGMPPGKRPLTTDFPGKKVLTIEYE